MHFGRARDVGNLAHPDSHSRLALREPFLVTWDWRHYLWATLLALVAVTLASYVPARRAAELPAGRDPARFKRMNSRVCLSCHEIERYLGEEESRVHALRGVSLQLEPGSVHAVVGPSGCGKARCFIFLDCSIPPMTARCRSNRSSCPI